MLRWIRSFRLDLKTGIAIIVMALAMWAVVVWVNVRDFVPDELTETPQAPGRRP